MVGKEEEEKYAKHNVNNVTMDTLSQSTVTINALKKDATMKNEKQIAADVHAETMKEFKGFSIQSTISNYAQSNSDELVDAISDSKGLFDAKSDPKSDLKVAT